jgi:hypothetical protein
MPARRKYARMTTAHRPHQALNRRPPLHQSGHAIDMTARIQRRRVLDGMVSEYRIANAKHRFSNSQRVLARHNLDQRYIAALDSAPG